MKLIQLIQIHPAAALNPFEDYNFYADVQEKEVHNLQVEDPAPLSVHTCDPLNILDSFEHQHSLSLLYMFGRSTWSDSVHNHSDLYQHTVSMTNP